MPLLTPDEFKSLKSRAMMAEKDEGLFTVRLGVVGGHFDALQLKNIAEMAEKFGAGIVHLTTRQGIEIPHVPCRNLGSLARAIENTGLRLAPAGKCVRAIVACPGTYCKFGGFDTQSLANELHDRFGNCGGLPHKFKISIAGCRHGCTKPQENDLGILGIGPKFQVFVGGKMGKSPSLANLIPWTITSETDLFSLVETTLEWYRTKGLQGERFATTLQRLGIAGFLEQIPQKSE
jgi:dissimilatory sulfite reductase (desulfoviridin) alpha/beta subunit